jgi:hypothetical protein
MLVLAGLVLLSLQLVGRPGRAVLLIAAGATFLAVYLVRRTYGPLVPGCLLIGIGLGWLGERMGLAGGDWGALGLGSGFVAIFAIDLAYRRRFHWWPLIPGVILLMQGADVDYGDIGGKVATWWPLALVVIGVLILFGAFGRKEVTDTAPRVPPAGSPGDEGGRP